MTKSVMDFSQTKAQAWNIDHVCNISPLKEKQFFFFPPQETERVFPQEFMMISKVSLLISQFKIETLKSSLTWKNDETPLEVCVQRV